MPATVLGRGSAHGFLTLADDREVCPEVDARHAPDHALAIAWKDPELAIDWPVAAADVVLSDADGDADGDARAPSFADWCGRRRALA